jgi:hypothetical protein
MEVEEQGLIFLKEFQTKYSNGVVGVLSPQLKTARAECTHHSKSSAAAARDTSPEMPLPAATAHHHGFWATGATPQPPDLPIGHWSRY